ncbi:hypothetical protein Tco_0570394 [Tanacetum coccineum]
MVRCSCGLEAVIRTSWTNRNPIRRFYGCPTISPTYVNFLRLFDPLMCQRSVQIITGFLRSRNELKEILDVVEEKRLNGTNGDEQNGDEDKIKTTKVNVAIVNVLKT